MHAPRKEDGAECRPRLSVVSSELRSRGSGSGSEPSRRLPAHPLEYDERGFPIYQPPLAESGRLGWHVTR